MNTFTGIKLPSLPIYILDSILVLFVCYWFLICYYARWDAVKIWNIKYLLYFRYQPDFLWLLFAYSFATPAYASEVVIFSTVATYFPLYCMLSCQVVTPTVSIFSTFLYLLFHVVLTILSFLFRFLPCLLFMGNYFLSFRFSKIVFWHHCASILFSHTKSCLLVISLRSFNSVSSLIISAVIVWALMPFINCSFSLLSTFLDLHSIAFILSYPSIPLQIHLNFMLICSFAMIVLCHYIGA